MHPYHIAVLHDDFVHIMFYSVTGLGTLCFIIASAFMLRTLVRHRG